MSWLTTLPTRAIAGCLEVRGKFATGARSKNGKSLIFPDRMAALDFNGYA
jgi:hypothetical protein